MRPRHLQGRSCRGDDLLPVVDQHAFDGGGSNIKSEIHGVASLGKIVAHEDVDADVFHRLDERSLVGLGHQHAHRAAHFVARILVDDGIDGAVDQARGAV